MRGAARPPFWRDFVTFWTRAGDQAHAENRKMFLVGMFAVVFAAPVLGVWLHSGRPPGAFWVLSHLGAAAAASLAGSLLIVANARLKELKPSPAERRAAGEGDETR